MPPERWLALSVSVPDDELAELLPEFLLQLGGSGVQETRSRLTTYLPPPPDLRQFLSEAQARLRTLSRGRELKLEWGWHPHQAWEELWRRGLRSRKVTKRLWVAHTWDRPRPGAGEIVITVDPGMAFGTAEHATTRGCLRLLERLIAEGDRIADVGAGSGILSIAAARLGAGAVTAFEQDPMACEVAGENVEANRVARIVRVAEGAVRGGQPLPDSPFDGILANIQCSVVIPLLGVLHRSLRQGGWLVLSGILLEEKEEVLRATADAGFAFDYEDIEGEWWSGAVRRGPSISQRR
jgi:ribosomal protein L11 methyltransferase